MSIFGKIGHAISRLFGGPSHGEKRARKSLLDQELETAQEVEARKNALIQIRRAVAQGRKSLLSWYNDERDSIGV